jgi:pimeloyl-ACP methyl ester carboxylesterase
MNQATTGYAPVNGLKMYYEVHGRISAPALLVFGDHDFFRLEHAVEMHALIPGAQLAVLPGATHMGVMRRADLMIPLVRGFLG